ncbi:MAG: T9SS type A sorting domain-containing protein [Cytophagaceae bacterium]
MKRSFTVIAFCTFACLNALAATITVTVSDFTFSPSTVTIQPGDAVMFNFTSGTHSVTSDNSKWTEFVGTAPASTTISTPFTTAGTYPYYCKFHGTAGGTGMAGTITVSGTTGIRPQISASLNIFPNPASDLVTISFDQSTKKARTLKITNAIGAEIKSLDLSEGLDSYSANFSDLEPGLYFCNLYSEDGIIESRKLIRTR